MARAARVRMIQVEVEVERQPPGDLRGRWRGGRHADRLDRLLLLGGRLGPRSAPAQRDHHAGRVLPVAAAQRGRRRGPGRARSPCARRAAAPSSASTASGTCRCASGDGRGPRPARAAAPDRADRHRPRSTTCCGPRPRCCRTEPADVPDRALRREPGGDRARPPDAAPAASPCSPARPARASRSWSTPWPWPSARAPPATRCATGADAARVEAIFDDVRSTTDDSAGRAGGRGRGPGHRPSRGGRRRPLAGAGQRSQRDRGQPRRARGAAGRDPRPARAAAPARARIASCALLDRFGGLAGPASRRSAPR